MEVVSSACGGVSQVLPKNLSDLGKIRGKDYVYTKPSNTALRSMKNRMNPNEMIQDKKLLAIVLISLFIATAFVAPASRASLAAQPLATLTLSNSGVSSVAQNSTGVLAGYNVELFRYPPQGGQPILVTQSLTDSNGQVSLSDPSLASMAPNQYVHYNIVVTRMLPTHAAEMVGSYDWSTYLQGGAYQTQQVSMGVSNTAQLQLAQQQAPSAQSSSPQTIGQPYCNGFEEGCWVYITTYTNVWTTIGEGHASGYMTNVFTFGTYSSASISVEITSGSGWSADGSSTQSASESTSWPGLHGYGGFYANTQYAYEDDEWYFCNPWDWNGFTCPLTDYLASTTYIVSPVYWQGSSEGWLAAGFSSSPPGECLSLSQIQNMGLSWEQYAGGSKHTITTANGYSYSFAAGIPNPYGGGSLVSFGSQTVYNQHTTEQYTFGTQYSTYYLYANKYYNGPDTLWPIVFTTNPLAKCSA